MSEELKPCPFCGSEPQDAHHIEYGRWAVTCNCGVTGACANTGPNASDAAKIKAYNDARHAWNTRALTAAQPAQTYAHPDTLPPKGDSVTKLAPSIHEDNYRVAASAITGLRNILGLKTGDSLLAAVQRLKAAQAAQVPTAEGAVQAMWSLFAGTNTAAYVDRAQFGALVQAIEKLVLTAAQQGATND